MNRRSVFAGLAGMLPAFLARPRVGRAMTLKEFDTEFFKQVNSLRCRVGIPEDVRSECRLYFRGNGTNFIDLVCEQMFRIWNPAETEVIFRANYSDDGSNPTISLEIGHEGDWMGKLDGVQKTHAELRSLIQSCRVVYFKQVRSPSSSAWADFFTEVKRFQDLGDRNVPNEDMRKAIAFASSIKVQNVSMTASRFYYMREGEKGEDIKALFQAEFSGKKWEYRLYITHSKQWKGPYICCSTSRRDENGKLEFGPDVSGRDELSRRTAEIIEHLMVRCESKESSDPLQEILDQMKKEYADSQLAV